MKTLKQYIDINYRGYQAEFARDTGVKSQQVTQWLKKDFIVVEVDGKIKMYSFRRELQDKKKS